MADIFAQVSLAQPTHAGVVIMRPHQGNHRGALLLNIAETEARIRYLPGYVSASFFVDADGSVLAEYVRWQSAEHLAAAFARPEFQEHLPVVEAMAPHPALAFGAPWAILDAHGRHAFDFAQGPCAMSILEAGTVSLDSAAAALADRYRGMLGHAVETVVLHKDAKEGRIALIATGRHGDVPEPPQIAGVAVVDHTGPLTHYSTVLAGRDPALALRYRMSPV